MTRFLIATALVAASAFGATAQTAPVALTAATEAEVLRLVPDADLSNITNAQYARIVSLFSSSENLRAGNDPKGALKVILNAQ
ncbi:MAG: hypothetical protein HC844_07670 [Tabrizicola sp.]|nr:hypothetical protein [Tabrizicola sp.]